jgi:hypothetical protein
LFIFQAASCSMEKALSYSWSVLCTNDDSGNSAKTRAESSPGFQLTSNKAALKIDAGSLVGGKTYRFTVVVSLTASPSTATTMTTDVAVEWSPLEPAIAGGLWIVVGDVYMVSGARDTLPRDNFTARLLLYEKHL